MERDQGGERIAIVGMVAKEVLERAQGFLLPAGVVERDRVDVHVAWLRTLSRRGAERLDRVVQLVLSHEDEPERVQQRRVLRRPLERRAQDGSGVLLAARGP